jgi:hypothetical protein
MFDDRMEPIYRTNEEWAKEFNKLSRELADEAKTAEKRITDDINRILDEELKIMNRGMEEFTGKGTIGGGSGTLPPQGTGGVLPNWNEKIRLDIDKLDISKSKLKYPQIESMVGQAHNENISRYWTHFPPSHSDLGRLGPTKEGGIQAYPLAPTGTRGGQGDAIGTSFKEGTNQKVIWLDPFPNLNIEGAIIVDATKLDLSNVLAESAGVIHAGDIPFEAIVNLPPQGTGGVLP